MDRERADALVAGERVLSPREAKRIASEFGYPVRLVGGEAQAQMTYTYRLPEGGLVSEYVWEALPLTRAGMREWLGEAE